MDSLSNAVHASHTSVRLNTRRWRGVSKYWPLYIMALPGVLFFLLFRYIPLAGSIIAFKDYLIFKGFAASPWVGFKHFQEFFQYANFKTVFMNTVILGTLNIVLVFPVPIVLALMFNEIKGVFLKRTLQTAFYMPHFFSWVIIAGIVFNLLSDTGIVNSIRDMLGLKHIIFLQKTVFFRPIIVLTSIWRDAGWGTIVLLAAIAGINPELYEAGMVDGANKFKQVIFIGDAHA